MLRFFRQARQKLIHEKRLSKYLIYAVGEIFLVVIGILIALQLNEWNDNRKDQREVEVLVGLLEEELVKNINRDWNFLAYAYEKDSLINLVLSEAVTKEMYYEQPALRSLITNVRPQTPYDEILLKILNKEENFPGYLKPLLPLLKDYRIKIDEYDAGLLIMVGHVGDHVNYFMNNHPWFSRNDSAALEDRIDYYLNDPIYRNKVYGYRNIILNNGAYRRTELRALALGLLTQIKIRREAYKTIDIRQLLENQGFSPFPVKSCETDFTKGERTVIFRSQFLFLNPGNEAVTLYRLDEHGKRLEQVDFAPHEIKTNPFMKNMFHGDAFETEAAGNCKRFVAIKDGYLLLE